MTYRFQTINTRHAWQPVLKPIAGLVVFAQVALVLQPLSVLAQEKGQVPFNPQAQAQLQRLGKLNHAIEEAKAKKTKEQQSPADKVSDKLTRVEELVKDLQSDGTGRVGSDSRRDDRMRELRELIEATQAGVGDVRSDFEAANAELRRKNLPAEILKRHEQARANFEQQAAQYSQIAAKLRVNAAATSRAQAGSPASAPGEQGAMEELKQFFQRNQLKRKPTVHDPKKLPWSTPKPNLRAPAETKTAWYQHLYADQKIRLAQAGGTAIGPLQFDIPPAPGQAPAAADLAETDEIQLTPAIRAKALELNNNPVAIYNWVRNNIAFAPTAGAIQSAQDTFDKKRGNATDTASLLIALLRAANIPARYQFGTVDIDAQRAQNWVGGTTRPEAALQLLNQGGVAARGLTQGGRLASIRMEHVWVSAYVNWIPGRGNRNATAAQHPNTNANLNAWVPLDGSFKQYSYNAGMDLRTALPFDEQALLDAAKQGATVNEAQGWVQNLNQVAVLGQLDAYQGRLKTYINSTPTGVSSTVGDLIGKKIVVQQTPSLLAGQLPYGVIQQGLQTSAVPSALQHKFTYRLYASDVDQAEDNPLLTFTEKTSKLVGKRLTLRYAPASQADANTIAAYLPKPHADGSPIQPAELPTSLPAYLIQLKPQISLDGQVVAQSSDAVQMGADLYSTGGFTQLYDASQWDLTSEESNVAGQATAIGISAGGISSVQMDQLRLRLTAIQNAIQSGNTATVAGLSGEQMSGDVLTATIWSWFAASERNSQLSQNYAGIVENPGLSYGLFHSILNPIYSWGVVRKVTFPGVNMDIGHVRNLTWAKDNSAQRWVDFNRLRGQHMSALEHAVPERFFSDPAQCNVEGSLNPNPNLPPCPQAISAVKAIALASQAGQKIFTITSEVYANNPGIVQSQLGAHSSSTRARIQQALDVGQEVTIHESPITQDGWRGAGFLLIDPATGAGGYLIEGGSNGASLLNLLSIVFFIFVVILLLAGAPALVPVIFLGSYAFGIAATLMECSDDDYPAGRLALQTILAMVNIVAAIAAAALSFLLKAVIATILRVGGMKATQPITQGQCW
jgi:transglutaminase-like putative cysteine protease